MNSIHYTRPRFYLLVGNQPIFGILGMDASTTRLKGWNGWKDLRLERQRRVEEDTYRLGGGVRERDLPFLPVAAICAGDLCRVGRSRIPDQ